MRRHLVTLAGVLATIAAVVLLKTAGQPAAARGQLKDDPPPTAAYEQACRSAAGSPACALLHGAMRARALEALDAAAAARDQRAVDSVVGYLDLVDEPELHEAAGRVLAQFPGQGGAAARARQLLFSDHTTSQRTAALLLEQGGDAGDRRLAAQWRAGHKGYPAFGSPYLRQPPQVDPARVRLQRYPGAERFSPGDSMSTLGLATRDPVERVVAFYARATGTTALDVAGWRRLQQAQQSTQSRSVQAEMPDLRNSPDVKEVERLAKEYQRTRNPALLKKLEAASKRLQEQGMAAAQRAEDTMKRTGGGLLEAYQLPGGPSESPSRTARFLVAERRGDRVARLVVVYREEAVGKTVIQLAWDPVVYPVPAVTLTGYPFAPGR